MAKQESRASPCSWRLHPSSSRLARVAERRGPRPWTRSEREHFLGHLARHATLDDALAEMGVDGDEAWAERLRDPGFARDWDRSLANRIARIPEMLLSVVVTRLRDPASGDADRRQAASIGQWLTEKCLPMMTRSAAPERSVGAGDPEGAPAGDWAEMERGMARHLAQVRQRLAARERAGDDPADMTDGSRDDDGGSGGPDHPA